MDLAVYHFLPEALSRTNPSLSLKSVQECHGRTIAESYLETASSLLFGNSTETSGEIVANQSTSAGSSAASTGSQASAAASSSSAAAAASQTGGTSAGVAQIVLAGAAWVGVVGAGLAVLV